VSEPVGTLHVATHDIVERVPGIRNTGDIAVGVGDTVEEVAAIGIEDREPASCWRYGSGLVTTERSGGGARHAITADKIRRIRIWKKNGDEMRVPYPPDKDGISSIWRRWYPRNRQG